MSKTSRRKFSLEIDVTYQGYPITEQEYIKLAKPK